MPTFLWTNTTFANTSTADLQAIKALNIDVLMSYGIAEADTQGFLDACYAQRLKVMLMGVEAYGKGVVYNRTNKVLSTAELDALANYVRTYKDHPALYGWYTDDEGPASKYPVSTRQQVYNKIKEIDPVHMVFEVNYQVETGAYSPGVHDIFAIDQYPYRTDGYMSAVEATALDQYEQKLKDIKAALDPSESRIIACMQAFETRNTGLFKLPPAGGVTKIWQRVQNAGLNTWGAGWFIYDSNPDNGEGLFGVKAYPYLYNEIQAIAATKSEDLYSADPAPTEEPMYFGAPFGGYFGQESNTTPIASPIELTATGTISIPGTVAISIYPVSANPVELSVSGSISIPGSVSMGIYSALPAVPIEIAVSGTIDIPASAKMRIIKIVRNLGRTSTYRFKEKPEQYTFKDIPDRYTWKGAEKLYQYILGETKPVQVDWTRKDGKDFTITSAIYAFEDLAEEPLSISGKSTLTNLTPTATGTKICLMEVELTPIDPNLPIEYRLAEVPVSTRKPRR